MRAVVGVLFCTRALMTRAEAVRNSSIKVSSEWVRMLTRETDLTRYRWRGGVWVLGLGWEGDKGSGGRRIIGGGGC